MTRADVVRTAYERFNEKDFDGVLDLCDPEIELRDLLDKNGRAHGRTAVRQRFAERFSDATVHVTIGNLMEVGDTVIAAVCCQVFDSSGDPVGPYIVVTDHFTFRGDRIVGVETTQFEEAPHEVRAVLMAGTAGTQTSQEA